MQGDAKIVVDAMNTVEENFTRYGHLVEDIKLFTRGPAVWKMQYVKRDFNQVAHLLTKDALLSNSRRVR